MPKLFWFKNKFISAWNLLPTCLSVNKTRNIVINLTLRHVCVTILAVESNKYYIIRVSVCSLSYPAYKALGSYYVICDLSGSTRLFPHYLIERQDSWKIKNMELNVCFMIFSTTLPKNFLILKRIQPGSIINVLTCTRKLSPIFVRF